MMNREDEEGAVSVMVRLANEPGTIFWISEHEESTSSSAQKRFELEKKLSKSIMKQLFEHGADIPGQQSLSIGELVAVNIDSPTLWKRGRLENKIHRNRHGPLWTVLLVDWGIISKVQPKDVVPLPKAFKSYPFYARHAVLGGIEPLSSSIDYSSPSMTLTSRPAKVFDESAVTYLEDKLKASKEFKIVLLGIDDDFRVHVRLFFKPNNHRSFFCLNDKLCAHSYAQPCDISSLNIYPIEMEGDLWESLPKLPIQSTLEEKSNAYTIAFSDYVKRYEMMREQKMRATSSELDKEEEQSPSEEYRSFEQNQENDSNDGSFHSSVSDGRPSEEPSGNSTGPSPLTVGRGRQLQIMKDHLKRQARTKSPEPIVVTSSATSAIGHRDLTPAELAEAAAKLRLLTTVKSKPTSSVLPQPQSNSTLPVSRSTSGSSSNVGRGIHPASVPLGRGYARSTPSPSISDETGPGQSVYGIIPAGMETRNTPSPSACLQGKDDFKWKSMGARPRVTPSPSPILAVESQMASTSSHSLIRATVAVEPKKEKLEDLPSSQTTSGQSRPNSRLAHLLKRIRPPCQPNTSSVHTDHQWEPNPGRTAVAENVAPPISQACLEVANINTISNGGPVNGEKKERPSPSEVSRPSSKLQPAALSARMKAALEKAKNEEAQQVQVNRVASVRPWVTPLPSMMAEESLAVRTQPQVASPARDLDDDMKELLDLATVVKPVSVTDPARTSAEPTSEACDAFPMLQRSKLLEVVEKGRVLVRSSFPQNPMYSLTEVPFDIAIHESLYRLGIIKPKTIQAHVWGAVLSGADVAYIAGAKSGKTLGYLLPILSSLMDKSTYKDSPKGCSPLVVIICPTWDSAEAVHEYCCQLMKCTSDFRSATLTDSTPASIQANMNLFVNGVTLLAATAPALAALLEEAKGVISFDRCHHLVLENADALLNDHYKPMKKLVEFYRQSVDRVNANSSKGYFVPRQIISCGKHWTRAIERLTTDFMNDPVIFISTFMEAAIFGRMKVDVLRGTVEEMDAALLEIVDRKRSTPMIIFCRDAEEIDKVRGMLSKIDVSSLSAHDQMVVNDLDSLGQFWESAPSGSAVLLCTDDVLMRLNIQNAQTLIHYSFRSKYDFNYRLSSALQRLTSATPESEKPECYLLITKEFENALLTITRFLKALGQSVPEDLTNAAVLCFGSKEYRKKDRPLCHLFKSFGFCADMKTCIDRHIVREDLDEPVKGIPKCGVVRIRINVVDDATCYYARILKYWDENKKMVDRSGVSFEIAKKLKEFYKNEVKPINGKEMKIGNLYAHRSMDGLYQRVRVNHIMEYDHFRCPLEAEVMCIDQGSVVQAFVQDLFDLPDELKTQPAEAVQIYLVGCKPLDRNTSWSRHANDSMRAKLIGKELEGCIVLALSNTLWLNPLHQRKLEGDSALVIMDVRAEILDGKFGEINKDHMMKLYHLCETGGMKLPDYTVGLSSKAVQAPPPIQHAFLQLKEATEVELGSIESPYRFYLLLVRNKQLLKNLEKDIAKDVANELTKCKKMRFEDAHVGKLCVVASPDQSSLWCRATIKKRIATNESWEYRVFFVDYGDYGTYTLDQLRRIPNEFVTRLPFQAIACSLRGIRPVDGAAIWSDEAIDFFLDFARNENEINRILHVTAEEKLSAPDAVTNGHHYMVALVDRKEANTQDLAQAMVAEKLAIVIEGQEDFNQSVALSDARMEELAESRKQEELEQGVHHFIEDEEEFEGWDSFFDLFIRKKDTPEESDLVVSESSPPVEPSKPEASDAPISSSAATTLYDHTLPLRADSSRFPTTQWAQNKETVFVNFLIPGITTYKLTITEDHLSFTADVDGLKYDISTYLYAMILQDSSTHGLSAGSVKLVLKKQQSGQDWLRLIRSPCKQAWLTRDFTFWSDSWSDEEETDRPIRTVNVDPKYAFDEYQSDSDEMGSDEDLADEFALRDEEE